ncbi:zinc finger protein 23-like [Osmerus eperlanus]|uniref:zinc finger protein 23-like n=1 Tax=Osmerus eperlanus TaxID=29151 RepID=UPI002E0D3DF7
MSVLDVFKERICARLTLTALEIFREFEKTLFGYKEQISRSKEESARIQRLLDAVTKPYIKLRRTDVQQLSLLEPPQIKEEQELWTSQEEEQLQGLKSETTDSIFTQESEFSNLTMSKLYMMREFFSERLTTAASEIFRAIEITVAEYKEEISRSKEESARIQRLFDVVTQHDGKLHRTEVQQLSLLEPPQIKEEQELWTSQEEEQLQGLQSETKDSISTSSSVGHDWDQDGFSECSHLDQAVQVDNREGDSLPTNTTEEQIKAETHVQDSPAPEPGSDPQPLSVVAPDCPAAQSLEEEEHGGMMPLLEMVKSSRKRKNTLPMEGMPQGSHTGDKPHQCLECKKSFTLKQTLLNHMIIHTGDKPFQCQECKKSFRWQSSMVTHMRIHTGEKPYQCLECNNTFNKKSTLVGHMRTHTGEKPYQCKECNKSFRWQPNLITHMVIHTGEKPFQCQECHKKFRWQPNMITHMRTHTGEKPFQCQECSRCFSLKCNLIKHIKVHTR